MDEVPLIGLRQFRERLDRLKGPVRVVKTRGSIEVLGLWLPEGTFTMSSKDDMKMIAFAPVREVSSDEDED